MSSLSLSLSISPPPFNLSLVLAQSVSVCVCVCALCLLLSRPHVHEHMTDLHSMNPEGTPAAHIVLPMLSLTSHNYNKPVTPKLQNKLTAEPLVLRGHTVKFALNNASNSARSKLPSHLSFHGQKCPKRELHAIKPASPMHIGTTGPLQESDDVSKSTMVKCQDCQTLQAKGV